MESHRAHSSQSTPSGVPSGFEGRNLQEAQEAQGAFAAGRSGQAFRVGSTAGLVRVGAVGVVGRGLRALGWGSWVTRPGLGAIGGQPVLGQGCGRRYDS